MAEGVDGTVQVLADEENAIGTEPEPELPFELKWLREKELLFSTRNEGNKVEPNRESLPRLFQGTSPTIKGHAGPTLAAR